MTHLIGVFQRAEAAVADQFTFNLISMIAFIIELTILDCFLRYCEQVQLEIRDTTDNCLLYEVQVPFEQLLGEP